MSLEVKQWQSRKNVSVSLNLVLSELLSKPFASRGRGDGVAS
jgi:hypothetical protein